MGYKIVKEDKDEPERMEIGKQASTSPRAQRFYGIMTAYKDAKFILKHKWHINLKDASTEYNAPADYARNNKAVILILEHQSSLRNIVVGNA